ncbi:hypothetical protein NECAME_10240 [Necator americanus]|uniref:RING-type E3 ubiquitin transferase n=1 Tax=Necator americanus TaxID=51031 RepID=W2TBP0_NECAM|nr:hypothetical protein NECAME_10240 [Necator americanus]ETN78611.1 hypothetical protein NECAME_10240 [Necator americanus]
MLNLTLWIASVMSERNNQKSSNRQQEEATTATKAEEHEIEDDFPHTWFRCSVCLERRSPSCTSCGHLFCWNCIQEHAMSADSEVRCPHCRSPFEPSQVVPLLNL